MFWITCKLLDSCFKLGIHYLLFYWSTSQMPLCAAQPDPTVFPHLRVLGWLLTTEPSVTLLVDHLWLCCVSLPFGVQCVPVPLNSISLLGSWLVYSHKTVETPRLIYSCPIISSHELQGLKIKITDKWTQMDNDRKHKLWSSMIDYVRRSKMDHAFTLWPIGNWLH